MIKGTLQLEIARQLHETQTSCQAASNGIAHVLTSHDLTLATVSVIDLLSVLKSSRQSTMKYFVKIWKWKPTKWYSLTNHHVFILYKYKHIYKHIQPISAFEPLELLSLMWSVSRKCWLILIFSLTGRSRFFNLNGILGLHFDCCLGLSENLSNFLEESP